MPLVGKAEGIAIAGLLIIMIGMVLAGIYLYFKKDKAVGAFMIMGAFIGLIAIGGTLLIVISSH